MLKKTSVVLSFDNRKKVTALFVLLVEVDKRMKSATKSKKSKEVKAKKARKNKKDNDDGSLCGPFLLLKILVKTLDLVHYNVLLYKVVT